MYNQNTVGYPQLVIQNAKPSAVSSINCMHESGFVSQVSFPTVKVQSIDVISQAEKKTGGFMYIGTNIFQKTLI